MIKGWQVNNLNNLYFVLCVILGKNGFASFDVAEEVSNLLISVSLWYLPHCNLVGWVSQSRSGVLTILNIQIITVLFLFT